MTLFFKDMSTPVGTLKLVASAEALVAVLWEHEREGRVPLGELQAAARHPILAVTEQQLAEYFSGARKDFSIPLSPRGTPFQLKVWKGLGRVNFGITRSYGDLARSIGAERAARAVGAALGRNPLAIVVPCHRVMGRQGALTGFAGGLEVKKFLLGLEGHPAFCTA
jgi:methylated-DNA-[protein]-cysteine S-methyltransferase